MQRSQIAHPRENWRAKVEEAGLIFWPTQRPDGSTFSYWDEEHYYSFTRNEVLEIEASARILLQDMLVKAGDYVIRENLFHRFGIPPWVAQYIVKTWEPPTPQIYGRFDFAYGEDGLKLLEYNADVPVCLVEMGAQWQWFDDHFGGVFDQWNEVWDHLVGQFAAHADLGNIPDRRIHMLYSAEEKEGEDFMTVSFLAAAAREAGLEVEMMQLEQLGLRDEGFVDLNDRPIRTAFKLWPWEWIIHERFGRPMLGRMGNKKGQTQWLEPVWKMLWSNKAILPILWRLYPDHPLLLPAYFMDEMPNGMLNFVRKPIFGNEGKDVEIFLDGKSVHMGPNAGYGSEGFVAQQYTELGEHHPVLGIWTVDMEPCGLGIRESDTFITDRFARFVPHIVEP